MLLSNMGEVCLDQFDHVQAGRFADQAAAIYESVHDQVSRGMALINRAEAHRGLGQFARARQLSEEALQMLRVGNHRRGEAIALDNLGLVALAMGEPEEAVRCGVAALAVARDIGSRSLEGKVLCHLGRAHASAGRWDAAASALEEAAALAQEVGAPQPLLETRAAQAELALAMAAAHDTAPAADALDPVWLSTMPAHGSTAQQPMWLMAVIHRTLQCVGDGRADAFLATAQAELARRADRIPDQAKRHAFLSLPEHGDFRTAPVH
jgi:tetratricopeptide (TPR) repeat protein